MATASLWAQGDDGPQEVVVTGVPRARWSALRDEHPPAAPGEQWGPLFVLALVIDCVTSHDLDSETASALLDDTDIGLDLERFALDLSTPGIGEGLLARLDSDPRLQAELAYCTDAGISRTEFLGWPDADQDLAVAWWVRRHDTCPGCGVPSGDMNRSSAEWMVRQRQCTWCDARHHADEETPAEHRHAVHVDLVRADEDGEEQ